MLASWSLCLVKRGYCQESLPPDAVRLNRPDCIVIFSRVDALFPPHPLDEVLMSSGGHLIWWCRRLTESRTLQMSGKVQEESGIKGTTFTSSSQTGKTW